MRRTWLAPGKAIDRENYLVGLRHRLRLYRIGRNDFGRGAPGDRFGKRARFGAALATQPFEPGQIGMRMMSW